MGEQGGWLRPPGWARHEPLRRAAPRCGERDRGDSSARRRHGPGLRGGAGGRARRVGGGGGRRAGDGRACRAAASGHRVPRGGRARAPLRRRLVRRRGRQLPDHAPGAARPGDGRARASARAGSAGSRSPPGTSPSARACWACSSTRWQRPALPLPTSSRPGPTCSASRTTTSSTRSCSPTDWRSGRSSASSSRTAWPGRTSSGPASSAGSLRVAVLITTQPVETQQRIRAAFDRLVEEYRRDDGIELPVSAKLASGRKPTAGTDNDGIQGSLVPTFLVCMEPQGRGTTGVEPRQEPSIPSVLSFAVRKLRAVSGGFASGPPQRAASSGRTSGASRSPWFPPRGAERAGGHRRVGQLDRPGDAWGAAARSSPRPGSATPTWSPRTRAVDPTAAALREAVESHRGDGLAAQLARVEWDGIAEVDPGASSSSLASRRSELRSGSCRARRSRRSTSTSRCRTRAPTAATRTSRR